MDPLKHFSSLSFWHSCNSLHLSPTPFTTTSLSPTFTSTSCTTTTTTEIIPTHLTSIPPSSIQKMLRFALAYLLVIGLGGCLSMALGMPPQCSPEVLEEIDNPKIREICHFLQTYAEAVEGGGPFLKGGVHFPLGLIDNGVKRQDVDHVFLRFGRRRR